MHGVEQQVTLGGNHVTLYPLFHPAAALYTPSMQSVLASDFARIPELLAREGDGRRASRPRRAGVGPSAASCRSREPTVLAEAVQLGLF